MEPSLATGAPQAPESPIDPEVSSIQDRVLRRLQAMWSAAKTYREPLEPKWERCKNDRAGIHSVKYEDGRAHYFVPLASTYSNTWVASNSQAQTPQPAFFVCEAYEKEGKDFEDKMEAELLHICHLVDFKRVIRESYWNFTDHGYTAILVEDDPELDLPRPEVVPPADVWVEADPISGVRDERLGRFLRRKTTLPDLMREQEASGGRKYDQAALDGLVASLPSQKTDKPQDLEICTYWGDLYVDAGEGQPTRLFSAWRAVWVDSPKATMLACSAIDTPGGVSPLHIFGYKQNEKRDLYCEPILWAGVGIQGLANSTINSGLDSLSISLKPTPWLRAGSMIAKRGIVFGQPMVSERADDIQDPLSGFGSGAGGDAIFNLLPMWEQEYARAVGATHTHSVEETPRTATEQAIRAAVVEVRTKHGNELAGEGFAKVLEQMQRMQAQRVVLAAMGQAPVPAEMESGEVVERRSLDQADEKGWTELDPAMWAFKYSIKMVGPGILSSRAERLIGAQSFMDMLNAMVPLDPTIPARLKATDTILKRFYGDATGYDHQELLIPIEEYMRMELIIRAQVQAEMAAAVEAQAQAASGAAGQPGGGKQPPGGDDGQASSSPVGAAQKFVRP